MYLKSVLVLIPLNPRMSDSFCQHSCWASLVDFAVCNLVLRLQCEIGQVCEEVIRVPRTNSAWGNALAIWGQYGMSDDEYRRRRLTQTLDSSSVRANTATHKFLKQVQPQTQSTSLFTKTRIEITCSLFSLVFFLGF